MSSVLANQVLAALHEISGHTRLYELKLVRSGAPGLVVEAFAADEQVQGMGTRDVIVLSTRANLSRSSLIGQEACLQISLSPWTWLLSQVRNCRAWQDKSVMEIIDDVFRHYQPHASWVWSGEVASFMAHASARSYCCQYRESDFDFVTRLLAEEGLAWRFEHHEGRDRMVLFADSSEPRAVPEDSSSEAGGGIRYHAASALEKSDSIQYLQASRELGVAAVTVLSYDYKSKQAVSISVPTKFPIGGKRAQAVESFDCPGQYAFRDARQARRYAGLRMEAHEARGFVWQGRSTVRTLRAGTRLCITDIPMKKYRDEAPDFVVLRVASLGVNNFPATATNGLAKLFGPISDLLEESLKQVDLADFSRAVEQAQRSGYANCFEAIPADRPWRPMVELSTTRTARGSQSAIVVGPDGSDQPNGADEIYCDRLGRVRIRFHWQEDDATCWVRVAQRSAGGGMGSQFLPRIGQEVLVKFIEGDIDRPVIVGALYNGQGEGGILPTPGGLSDRASSGAVFEPAYDNAVSGQGNLAGGNSPVWHGASADSAGHRNNSAQWGIRSKEFGGRGYNQLVFDDTDGQGRIQLKSTHGATELNMGHLIHSADNYRGSFRGSGAELRTDNYGAVRAGAGLLISSYKISHSAASREAAGENSAANSMLKQTLKMADSFSAAARTHATVAFGSHLGATQQNTSAIDDKAAPLKALWTMSAGMLSRDSVDAARADAASRNIDGDGKLPHTCGPMIAIAAKAGLGVVAGQDVQLSNGETVVLMSGADTQFINGGQMRVHSGQAIGVLAGAVEAGEGGVGLQLIAGKGAIDYQAQADELKVQARDEIKVVSANAHVDWAAAKSISLSTAGGANITIEGGNITVQCPGKIPVHAGKKKLNAPDRISYPLPNLPNSNPTEEKVNFGLALSDMPGANGRALPGRPWNIVLLDMGTTDALESTHWRKVLASGTSDENGTCVLSADQKKAIWDQVMQFPQSVWLVSGPNATPITFTKLAASKSEKNERRILDALNYGRDQEHLDSQHNRLLSQWAEQDYGSQLNAKPNDNTKAK